METQTTIDKPHAVATAVKFLWMSFWLGIVLYIINLPNTLPSGSAVAAGAFFIMLISIAISALLIFKISAGRNWARITLFVLYVFGVLVWLYGLGNGSLPGSPSGLAMLGGLVNYGLQGYALFLLLTDPVNVWFRKASHSSHVEQYQPAPLSANSYCSNCGAALTAGSNFCAGCGVQVT